MVVFKAVIFAGNVSPITVQAKKSYVLTDLMRVKKYYQFTDLMRVKKYYQLPVKFPQVCGNSSLI